MGRGAFLTPTPPPTPHPTPTPIPKLIPPPNPTPTPTPKPNPESENDAETAPESDTDPDAGSAPEPYHVVAPVVGASVSVRPPRRSPTEPPITARSVGKHGHFDAELSEAPPNEDARSALGVINTVPKSRVVISSIADPRWVLSRPIPANSALGGSSVNSASASPSVIAAIAVLGG